MNAIRTTSQSGKATIEITFDDGTTAKVGGKRAARAAAVVVWKAGEYVSTSEWDKTVYGPGWYVEGCRQSVYAAHLVRNAILGKPRNAYRPYDEVKVLVVTDAEAIAAG